MQKRLKSLRENYRDTANGKKGISHQRLSELIMEKYGIIGAMESEVCKLCDDLAGKEIVEYAKLYKEHLSPDAAVAPASQSGCPPCGGGKLHIAHIA